MAAAKTSKACPAGHALKACSAEAGSCNGCRRMVRDGDLVMDCRQCNYYLCNECHNGRGSLWIALASFIPDCTADAHGNTAATEVIANNDDDCEPTPVVDPRCNRRQDKDEGAAKPPESPEDSKEANEPEVAKKPDAAESNIAAGANGGIARRARHVACLATGLAGRGGKKTVDLLGDLFAPQTAASKPPASKPATANSCPPVDILAPAELAAPADLGLLGVKGKDPARRLPTQAARLGAA